MKLRYINLSNKKRYLIWTTGNIPGSSDDKPNKYVSYITPQEFYGGHTAKIHDCCVGYVIGGVYTGLLGTFTDANNNRYTISFSGGEVSVKVNSSEAARHTGDCIVHFFADFEESGQYGLKISYPWNNGSYISAGSGYAWCLVNNESAYNALMGEYGTRNNKNIGYIDSSMNGKITISNINDYNYMGVFFYAGTTSIGSSSSYADGPGLGDSTSEEDSDDDPYNDDDDGESGGGGGDGDHDDSSDPVPFPDLPDLSATDTGFITLYNPSVVQLKNLANYMWAGLFDINTFKKLFADPMDAVLGLSIVPVSVPSAGAQNVTIGNVSTGVSMTKASSQYVTVDCGTVDITEYWGSYLDYDPYTKIELFLPYIGTRQIATDDVMGKSIQIKYNVDILSGSCTACVMCGNSVLYSFEGQCSCNIPITGNDWSSTISSAITAATAIGSVVATSGASAPLAAGEAAKATKDVGKYISVGGSVASSAANVSKPNIAKSGSVSSMSGMLGIQKPYFIITRPRHAVPGNQNQYQGYPAFITKYLGSLSGYTEIDSIILNYVSASDTEEAEIIKLLQGGVIL